MKRSALFALVWLVGCSNDLIGIKEYEGTCKGVTLGDVCAPCTRWLTPEKAGCPEGADVLVCEGDYEPQGYFEAPEKIEEKRTWCDAVFCETENQCVERPVKTAPDTECVETFKPDGTPCVIDDGTNSVCLAGTCALPPCGGCVANDHCRNGLSDTWCGIGGNACVSCGAGLLCVDGACEGAPACEDLSDCPTSPGKDVYSVCEPDGYCSYFPSFGQ